MTATGPHVGPPCCHHVDLEGAGRAAHDILSRPPDAPIPLTLPPPDEQDNLTRAFEELQKTCKDKGKTKRVSRDWISMEMWVLIEHRTMLRCTGHLQLFQAVWTTGTIPCQLLWIIVVLIPKSSEDFCGIGPSSQFGRCWSRSLICG